MERLSHATQHCECGLRNRSLAFWRNGAYSRFLTKRFEAAMEASVEGDIANLSMMLRSCRELSRPKLSVRLPALPELRAA
jgi:hypothetical protein